MSGFAEATPAGLIASRTHTARLIAIFAVLALGGFLFYTPLPSLPGGPAQSSERRILLYLSLMGSEWLLFKGVCAGIRRTGRSWRDLLGASFFARKGMLLDFALAAAVVASWMTPLILLPKASLNVPAAARALFPRGVFEIVVWAGLSASAGICEEFAFRGYFQRQFAALTKNRWLGVALQAVLFGAIHSYQGPSACGLIGLYGAVLGGLAIWRRNLRAAMIAHAFTDLIVGIFLA
jgi:membrane protease YdiL (CAAX protease family)